MTRVALDGELVDVDIGDNNGGGGGVGGKFSVRMAVRGDAVGRWERADGGHVHVTFRVRAESGAARVARREMTGQSLYRSTPRVKVDSSLCPFSSPSPARQGTRYDTGRAEQR
jgi:hypothetical protein